MSAVTDPLRARLARRPGEADAGSLTQRAGVRLLELLSLVLRRLPAGVLHRAAHAGGLLLYLVAGRRRSLVRANLRRICRHVADTGAASPRVAAAARDPRALERLVRSAFGHYVRYYVEMIISPTYDGRHLDELLTLETPDVVREALDRPPADGPRTGAILVGLHFGALELPALYVTTHSSRPVLAPMETISNAPLQRYVERTRARSGVTLVPLAGARRRLRAAVASGAIVGLIADRDVSRAGVPVTLFGAPASLPIGPALLAVETGAPVYVAAVRRTRWGRYAARMVELPTPTTGRPGERILVGLAAQARLFERLIADAPEQWWTIFFQIWSTPPRGSRR